MEDVRAVLVDQQAGGVEPVIGVAADMAAAVDQQHALVALAGQPLGQHAAGEAGADDEPVKHGGKSG